MSVIVVQSVKYLREQLQQNESRAHQSQSTAGALTRSVSIHYKELHICRIADIVTSAGTEAAPYYDQLLVITCASYTRVAPLRVSIRTHPLRTPMYISSMLPRAPTWCNRPLFSTFSPCERSPSAFRESSKLPSCLSSAMTWSYIQRLCAMCCKLQDFKTLYRLLYALHLRIHHARARSNRRTGKRKMVLGHFRLKYKYRLYIYIYI